MVKQTIVDFELAQKEILNANSIPSHFIVKGKMVAFLRETAADAFVLHHPEEHQERVRELIREQRVADERALKRKRMKKRLLEGKNKLSLDEVERILEEEFPIIEKSANDIPPLHTHFKVQVIVYPPTRRRLDPPNLYPTVKPILDGGTDAGVWLDDDFTHLLEMSFRYGGLSGLKSRWKLRLIFTEIEDLKEFQTEAEFVEE